MTMRLALICLPIGLATLGFVIALLVDSLVHDRASRARAIVRRETVPMLPWPYPERAERGQVRRVPVRDERGHADDSFLRKLTMVCVVVLVLSGLIVYWIGEGTPDHTNDHGPRIVHRPADGHKRRPARELAAQPKGGAGCGQGA
jgi:hypothetical protein